MAGLVQAVLPKRRQLYEDVEPAEHRRGEVLSEMREHLFAKLGRAADGSA